LKSTNVIFFGNSNH